MNKKVSVSNKSFENKFSSATLNGCGRRKTLGARALKIRRLMNAGICKKIVKEMTNHSDAEQCRQFSWRDLARPVLSVGLKLIFGVAISYIGFPYAVPGLDIVKSLIRKS